MAANQNVDRIVRLQKYIETMKNRKVNVPERRKDQKEAYLAFIDLEVKKAERTIEKLR